MSEGRQLPLVRLLPSQTRCFVSLSLRLFSLREVFLFVYSVFKNKDRRLLPFHEFLAEIEAGTFRRRRRISNLYNNRQPLTLTRPKEC